MSSNNDSECSNSGGRGRRRKLVPRRGQGEAKLKEMKREEEQNKQTRSIHALPQQKQPVSPSSSCSMWSYPLPAPSIYFQFSPSSSNFSGLQPSSNDSHSASISASSNHGPRNANRSSPLELNTSNFSSDNAGPDHYNLLPFGSPSLPSPYMHEIGERSVEHRHRRSESSGRNPMPFYNFLEVKDQVSLKETSHASNHDEGTDGIDLHMKL